MKACHSLRHHTTVGAYKKFPQTIARLWQRDAHPSATKSDELAPDFGSVDNDIVINGFVRSVRKQKRIGFAVVGDGSSLQPIQAVLSPEHAENLSNGAAVQLKGAWKQCPPGKQQTHELHVIDARVLGENDATSYPLQKKYQSPEFLRTLPHLRARLPFNTLLLRLRSQTIASLTSFFGREDFVQTHTPIITSSDCEGAGEVFTVSSNAPTASEQSTPAGQAPVVEHFFKTPKYLTVSSQLHLEALAQAVSKVWTLSPTFRAEKSDTPRHLSEFYMLEAEMCFVDNMDEVMNLIEGMLATVAKTLQNSRLGQELLEARGSSEHDADDTATVTTNVLEQRWRGMAETGWPRITYEHAMVVLKEAAAQDSSLFQFEPTHVDGLQAEHERYLASNVGKGSPIFVTNYPRDQKPFYMASSSGSSATVACFDLLVPDLCELVGGSMREHRSEELIQAMRQHGLLTEDVDGTPSASEDAALEDAQSLHSTTNLQWYIDLRRYGSVPHGGFGLGFDRLLSYLSGASNIRDVVAFPRWHGRCDC